MTERNEKLMEQLFHNHYERMYRLAFALLHDNEEAKDVVSDVFSKLWDAEIKEETASAYLMRSVKNACLNFIARKERDERLQRLLPLEDAIAETDNQLEARWQAAVNCIDHDLTPQTASVIRLYLQLTEQMSLDDIIELMNHFEKVNIHVEGRPWLLSKL